MKNLFRQKMKNGEKTLGTFHELGSQVAVELLAYAGMDYVIIDEEHGPFDPQSTSQYIRAAKLAGTTPFVRIKDFERNSILRSLDVGAMGLIIPNVKSVNDVKKIIEFGKYYPLGDRGVAPTSGSQYWTQEYARNGLDYYFETCNREQLIIPQCETKEALESIETIVNLPGVDGIFVGPYDLSTSMGKPGQFQDKEVIEAIKHILNSTKKAEKFAIIYGIDAEDAIKRFQEGYDSVTVAMDAIIFSQAVENLVKKILK